MINTDCGVMNTVVTRVPKDVALALFGVFGRNANPACLERREER